MSRILGLDYGERRIGVALTDPTRTIASPYGTLTRRSGKRPPWSELLRIIQEQEVTEIVIGLPLDLAGSEGDWSAEVREFGAQLQQKVDLPVHWVDERMSSVRAERAVRGIGLKKSAREEKSRVDAAAAALILQTHLEMARNEERRRNDA